MDAVIHVGDVGTAFRVTLKDQAGLVVDLTAASAITFVFLSPKKRRFEVPAVFSTDGKDGKVEYVSKAGDLDVAGRWQLQVVVTMGIDTWHSNIGIFTVGTNL